MRDVNSFVTLPLQKPFKLQKFQHHLCKQSNFLSDAAIAVKPESGGI